MTDFNDMTVTYFDTLAGANKARDALWDPEHKISPLFRAVECAGEVGEVMNVIKKLEREKMGLRGSRDTIEHLAEELADGIICLSLIAMQYGIDLDDAVVRKFNATSEANKLPVLLRGW